ncbi:hypothetical protein SPRG_09988 [Saprolegnia parasitica CBS 223.65]|uniref:Uncharacterized protein n=1 Tax=Saprolegnia parasitica (strain CBS 223.65) TaxID=695850 RepID=A0A067C261_SAPPC|nr:hypothetical protein SPRG_09988 [Saprolegnia parasitica CBS 223.65]KDO23180.1 hypothetical protein SPRG_09988 [Saprolegnia parasitica CBS 223.65]|eukprot:XP_012206132.1 hypothetical protein SPRG_09988 [Saprolegnia parasitica CBS 223.65]
MSAYETAYELLDAPGTFATIGTLKNPSPFLFTLRGMDEPLAWPLCSAQAREIAALFPDTKIIPASCESNLVPSDAFYVNLSHMVLDDDGDSNCLRPLPAADEDEAARTFGTLVALLPSAHAGGVVTFSHRNETQRFNDDASLLHAAYATTFLSTSISSSPITSGRRAALVYRVVYVAVHFNMRFNPPVQDAAIAAFRALGLSVTEPHHRIGFDVTLPEVLPIALVHALLATGCFDVGLAAFRKSNRNDKVVSKLCPHPECDMPPSVVASWKSIQWFLQLQSIDQDTVECPEHAIVFWPKRHRAWLVGIADALAFVASHFAAAQPRDSNLLGLADPRELVMAAMSAFNVQDRNSGWHESSEAFAARHKPSLLSQMQRILVAYNDFELTTTFLRDCISITNDVPLAEVAVWLHGLLTTHGWERFEPAMLGLVQRWIRTTPIATLRLLTSLAGLDTDDKAVCPPLLQPFEAELFKRCYHIVRATPDFGRSLLNAKNDSYGRGSDFVKYSLLLEHYVTTIALQRADANFVGHWLPPVLVAAVDTFLFPAHPSILLTLATTDADPLMVVAVGLASAALTAPSLRLPTTVLDGIFCALEQLPPRRPREKTSADRDFNLPIPQTVTSVDAVRSVLVLAQRANRLDATFFDTCVDRYGLFILPAIRPLASNQVHLGALHSLVVEYIHRSIHALLDKTAWPDLHEVVAYRQHGGRSVSMGVHLTREAVMLLQSYAQDSVASFATAWLKALPTDIRTTHKLLVPLVDLLPRNVAAYRLLAAASIARFDATPPLSPVVDFALRDVALDPTHCSQCKTTRTFLDDPANNVSENIAMSWASPEQCPNVLGLLQTHASRVIQVEPRRDWLEACSYRLFKVTQPGQVSVAQLGKHRATARILASVAEAVVRFKTTLRRIDNNAEDPLKPRPSKRHRHG